MKDKARYVSVIVEKWKVRLGLSDWIVNVHIRNESYPDDETIEACITEDAKYKEADLEIWNQYWKFDEKHKEINIVHELTHLVLCKLHPFLPPIADDTLEEVVQTLAMSLYRNDTPPDTKHSR